MPTYEFRCPAGHDFERFFGRISTAPAEVECPECGVLAHRRISGGAGLVFKGSGFYITDYQRGEGYKKAAQSDGGGGSGDAKPADSKPAESAPAPKADPAPAAKPAPKSE